MEQEEVVARVQALVAAWNSQDLDAFVALLTPDVWWHDLAMLGQPAVGRREVRAFASAFIIAFPDMRYRLRGSICVAEDGVTCAVPWVIEATNTGYLDPPGFAPTGRQVRIQGLDYLTLRDGLVARIETLFDPAETVKQLLGLSLLPEPGSIRERVLVRIQRIVAAWLRKGRIEGSGTRAG